MPPGALHLLILRTLAFEPLHGYAIAQRFKIASGVVLNVEEGSLYPALQRMLMKGWVEAEWVQVGEKRRTRVYRLTPDGQRRLAVELETFQRTTNAILRVIQPAEAS